MHASFLAIVLAASSSIYQLPVTLRTSQASNARLDVFAGHKVLISMFYSACAYACPTLIANIKKIESALTPQERASLRVLMVSFDPERDTPARLKQVAAEHHLDARWLLASAADPRALAAVLGIQYRKISGGDFNHTSVVSLLDAKGVIKSKIDNLGDPIDALVAEIKSTAP